jgi:type IV secretion system protein VirB6
VEGRLMACAPPVYGVPFLSGVLNYVDCQTQAIAGGGYQALASPAATAAPIILAALTLFVALLGLRMLAGQVPTVGDLTVAVLKVGIVLTLATSWIAYRQVVVDPVQRGPSEIGAAIGRSAGLAATDGSLVEQLQAADDALVRLTDLGAGRLDRTVSASADTAAASIPARAPLADDLAFGFARIAFLAGVIGTLGIVQLVGGVALGLAPIFAVLLLFEATRGIFIGWLRLLFGVAVGALLASLILAVELGVLLPWLQSAIALRETFYATPAAPIEVLALTLCFAIILFAAVSLAARFAMFSASVTAIVGTVERAADSELRPLQSANTVVVPERASDRGADRVAQIVTSLTTTADNRSEGGLFGQDGSAGLVRREGEPRTSSATPETVPLGQRYRSTGSRVVPPAQLGMTR